MEPITSLTTCLHNNRTVEAAMHHLRVLSVAAFVLVAPAFADAQQMPDKSAPVSLTDPGPTGANSGTHPDNIGKTGWTGGRADTHRDGPDSGEDPSWYATGADLKGPATQFPANKTPE